MPTFRDIYNGFKEKKQQPVLLLMLTGIVAVLFSFGYFLKVYMVDNIQNITTNITLMIVLGFALSAGFFIIGLLLKNNKTYSEFSSAVLGLSILLNFMLIYFMSLLSTKQGATFEFLVGAAIVLNTVGAIYLTIRYTDRLLALLSIMGGVFAPFFFEPLSSGEPQYFIYLIFIAIASVYIGYSLHWNLIVSLAFWATFGIIEYFVININNEYFFSAWYVFIFHGFAYIFIFYNVLIPTASLDANNNNLRFFDFFSLSPRNEIRGVNLFILLASISLLMFNLFFYFGSAENYDVLGYYLIFNTLPFIAAFGYYRSHKIHTIQMVMLAIAGFIMLFGLLSFAFNAQQLLHYIGLLLSFEAIVFVYLGYNYQLHDIRRYGYLFYLFSCIPTFYYLKNLFSDSEELLDYSYFNLIGLGITLIALNTLTWVYSKWNKTYENRFRYISDEFISIWFIIVSLITTLHYLPQWLTLITVIPTFYLFYRARTRDLTFTRFVAYIILAILLGSSSYWVITDMGDFWGKPDFYTSYPFWNFFIAGGIFFSFIFWKRYLLRVTHKTSDSPISLREMESDNTLMRIAKSAALLWAAALLLIVSTHENKELFVFVGIIPVGLLILAGYQHKLLIIRYVGFALLLVIIGLVSKELYHSLTSEWEWVIVSKGYLQFVWGIVMVVAILLVINIGHKKFGLPLSEMQSIDANKYLSEILVILVSVAGVVFAYYEMNDYAYILCPLAIGALLYISHHKHLFVTEFVGFFFYIVLAYGLYDTYTPGISMLKQEPKWYIIGAEAYGLLWVGKFFYYAFLKNNMRIDMMEMLHNLFYFLLPLIIVFFAYRKIGEYMPYVLWGTVVITFILSEVTLNSFIYRQWYVWLAAASGYSAWHYHFYILVAGLAALWLLLIYKKGVVHRIKGENRYRYLASYTYLYTVLFVFTAYYHTTNQLLGGLMIASLLLLGISFLKYKVFVARTIYKLTYRLSLLILFYILWQLVNSFALVPELKTSYTASLVEILLLPINLFFISYLLYGKSYIYSKTKPSQFWRFDMILLHLLYMATYIFFVRLIFTHLSSVALTVAWFIHAIQLMFYSIRPKYKFLSKLSYLMFFFALLKFIFADSEGLETPQLIMSLMILGLIFIGSSFLFVKFKDKIDKKAAH